MKTKKSKNPIIRRYTTLPVLLDLLTRRKLVLLPPKTWEDRNDAQVMLAYKARRNLKHIFAICFSQGDETIHHWNAFAHGPSGCCVEFYRDAILKSFSRVAGARFGSVKYRKLKEVRQGQMLVKEMPFTKRWPYRIEEEFRIIFESDSHVKTEDGFFEIDIDLAAIRRITLNQQMPRVIYATISALLKGKLTRPDQRICQSTLDENKGWIQCFQKL